MIDRIINRLKVARAPVHVDERINQNVRNFQKSIRGEDIKKYKRPNNWQTKIEVVIPCYNHAPYLEQAFEGILNQTRTKGITVTFINDKSTDSSFAVMTRIKNENSAKWINVRIIDNKKNLNQAGSINKAVSSSKNQLFVMLNADDVLTPDCLELIVRTYEKHTELALLGGSSLWFEENNIPKFKPKPIESLKLSKYGPEDAKSFTELNSINMSQSSCSFFKTAWELVGGYFERERRICSFDDRDFQMRICSVLPIGIYENYPMEFYRTSSSQGRGTS
jgi:glycosyltransferase involved in cell wall biosynthesis